MAKSASDERSPEILHGVVSMMTVTELSLKGHFCPSCTPNRAKPLFGRKNRMVQPDSLNVGSSVSLRLENLSLRHQVAVYKQTVHRPRLCPTDRLFWAWLSRLWPGWRDALAFVQPRTVIAWQHKRFREHWQRLSQRGTPGRPALAKEVRDLIRQMWQANPMWGSPRIVGELRKLGIDVAKSTVEKYVEDVSEESHA